MHKRTVNYNVEEWRAKDSWEGEMEKSSARFISLKNEYFPMQFIYRQETD